MLIFGCVYPDILYLVVLNSWVTTSDPALESAASHSLLLLALLEFSSPGVLPFWEEVTSRWHSSPGIYLTHKNSQTPVRPNEGLPQHHRSLQTQTLVFYLFNPLASISGSVDSTAFQCSSHFSALLLTWQAQLLDPWVSYPWNQIPGTVSSDTKSLNGGPLKAPLSRLALRKVPLPPAIMVGDRQCTACQ